jgi:hypothetical protein
MGLLKKKDRDEGPPPQEGSLGEHLPPMGELTSPNESSMAKGAHRKDTGSHDTGYSNELRLAVEAVAAGSAETAAPASDKYGLLAELEAQRRSADDVQEPASVGPVEGAEDLEPDFDAEPPAEHLEVLQLEAPLPEPQDVTPHLTPVKAVVEAPAVDDPSEPDPEQALPHAASTALPEVRPQPERSAPPAAPSVSIGAQPAVRGASEARARLEAFERSILEKTEAMRQRAAELAQREQELVAKVESLDALELEAAERYGLLEERERELHGKLAELQAEAERLEEEQSIWGEATRESKARLTDLEQALAAKEVELQAAQEAHLAKLAELDQVEAHLVEREAAAATHEEDLAAGEVALAERESKVSEAENRLSAREDALGAQEAELRAREDDIVRLERELEKRQADVAANEARVSDGERELERREADLVARESSLRADLERSKDELAGAEAALETERERLEQERVEWDEMMGGAFSRLSELESDLVSSLSVAGMLKRELEGRDAGPPKERRPAGHPAPRVSEQEEARAFYRPEPDTGPSSRMQPIESDGLREAVAEANGAEAQANATDWWARQLGRRKKD